MFNKHYEEVYNSEGEKTMKKILILLSLILLSTDFALAQCGRHRQQEAQTRQRSSVVVSDTDNEKTFKKLSTVSKKEAKKIAISNYPGKIKKAELARDENTLVWKLEVKGKEGQKELFIDPASGTFLGYGLTK